MYYATYKNVGRSDIAVFETEKARDEWVDFKDEFSVMFGTTKETATFERVAITNQKEIESVVNNPAYLKITDSNNARQWWYIRSN